MTAKIANKGGRQTMAERADIHELYEESVQNVENEVYFLSKTFNERTGRTAFTFREDFCGTFAVCCERCEPRALRGWSG